MMKTSITASASLRSVSEMILLSAEAEGVVEIALDGVSV